MTNIVSRRKRIKSRRKIGKSKRSRKYNIKGKKNKVYRGGETRIYPNGDVYEGDVNAENNPHGKGTMNYNNGIRRYEGEWENGQRSGQGTYTYTNGSTYVGNWVNGRKNGQGTMRWTARVGEANGDVYEGNFADGWMNGHGIMKYDNGDVYEGNWGVDGLRHGRGIMKYANGDMYDGNWFEDEMHGFGRMRDANGNIIHQGRWNNGKKEGPTTRDKYH